MSAAIRRGLLALCFIGSTQILQGVAMGFMMGLGVPNLAKTLQGISMGPSVLLP